MSFLQFIIKKYSWKSFLWVLALIVLIFGFGASFWYFDKKLDDRWTNIVDPTLAVFGLIVPIILGIFLLDKEWKGSLEKRLTVHFKFKDKYVMSCFEAYLSSEADIRNWGQQIGQQMNNGSLLSFYPYLHQLGPTLLRDKKNNNKKYLGYELTIFLKFDKDGNYIPIGDISRQFNPNSYKIWFDNDSEYPGNEQIEVAPNENPLTLEEAKMALVNQK